MMLRNILFSALMAGWLCASPPEGDSPAPVSFKLSSEYVIRMAGSAPSYIRIEIARIAKDTQIDPYVTPANFEEEATMIALMRVEGIHEKLIAHLRKISEEQWKKIPDRLGCSRLRIRFLGAWNRVFIELYIMEEEGIVLYQNSWYKLPREAIRDLVHAIEEEVAAAVVQ